MTIKSPIPESALAQHIAVLGKTGSGKSYAVRGAAVEPLLDQDARVCVIDPTGAWHGLRSSASGARAGYPVCIFGGAHADLPLGAAHGEAIAEVIGTSSTPSILDTSLMKVGERTRFFADFADAIVRKNKGPLHLVIDEAHLFAPQGRVNDPQSGAMLHAANNLVSLGRSRGLRIILVTQRPAKLHKDSLTQVETLIAMRLIAPQDRAAVESWIEDNADDKKARDVLGSLATLKTGEGWIWAPELGVLERVKFPKIKTFDSGSAPDGTEVAGAKVLAPIDREAIATRLKDVSASALADDPKVLRKEIADLKQQLASKGDAAATREQLDQSFQEGRKAGQWEQQLAGADRLKVLGSAVHKAVDEAFALANVSVSVTVGSPVITGFKPAKTPLDGFKRPEVTHKSGISPAIVRGTPGIQMSKAERRALTALAQYPEGRTRSQVAILAGYASTGGGFNNALSALRTKGFMEGSSDRFRITENGLYALGSFDPLPQGQELLRHWLGQLSKAERAALEVLAGVYPSAMTKDQLAQSAGYEANGGGFNNALSKLRTLELITGRGELKASEDLF